MTAVEHSTGAGFSAASATHVGCIRKENEDALAPVRARPLWAVADGMGGHARGAWAAASICAAVDRTVLSGALHHDCEALADALADANEHIHAEGVRTDTTIGSTVVALVIAERRYACLWAGDSRIYLLRGGELRQLTRDHSQVEELIAAGVLDRDEARDHPLGNVITRAIGVAAGLAIDVIEDAVLPGDTFLLCSDGLTKVVDDETIAAVIGSMAPEAACAELIRLTVAGGAPDNVSVLAVRVDRNG